MTPTTSTEGMRGKKPSPTVGVVLVGLAYIAIVTRLSMPSLQEYFDRSHTCMERKTGHLDAGLLRRLFPWAVQMCSISDRLHIEPFTNSDETKYFIMPVKPEGQVCSIVSLGIGFDVDSELLLKTAMPHCDFYGADPINKTNADIFQKVGKFYNIAVGGKNGTLEAMVLEGKDEHMNGLYYNRKVPYMDLATFFRKYLPGRRIIDLLIIDIEHAEYEMLPLLLNDGQPALDGIAICQINIEVHNPSEEEMKLFWNFHQKVLAERRFSMLITSTIIGHTRLFMIDRSQPACLERFFDGHRYSSGGKSIDESIRTKN